MIKLLTATFVTVALVSSSCACWFPFFPTYSAGYPAWGYQTPAYSYASYAPSYGYGAQRNCGYGYGAASYGVPYVASYGGFSNTCGQSPCCGTCSMGTVGFANCGSGCGSGCGSVDCIPSSGTRNKPVPDSVGGGTADEKKERPSTYEPPRSNWPYKDNQDDFGSGSGMGSDSGEPLWAAPRDGGYGEPNNKPPFGTNKIPAGGGTEDGDIQRSMKPPVSDPMKEEEAAGSEEDPDVLGPEEPSETARRASIFFASNREFRSSHYDVLRPERTLGRAAARSSATQISTSRKGQRAPRWISVPMPAGRERS